MKKVKLRDITSKLQSGDGIKASKIYEEGLFPVFGGNGLRGYTDSFNQDGEYFFIGRQGAKCGNVHYNIGKAFMTEHAVVGCPKEGYDAIYLAYKLSLLDLGKLQGQSAQPGLAVGTLADVELMIPECSLQQHIGKLLRDIDQKISLNTRMNAELEAMSKQLYDYWFVQFDFPDEYGKPYKSSGGKMVWNEKLKREIPEGWGLESISNILDKVVTTPRLITDEYLKFGNYPIIDQTTDVYYAGFTNREDAVSYQYPTVIFGDHSCAVKYVNFPFVRGADGTQVMLSKNKNVSIEYLYFVVKQIKVSKGYARHYGFIKDSLIIIPSHAISLKFKDIVELLFTQITKNRKDMVYLTQLRDSLLPMLMNGQVTIE